MSGNSQDPPAKADSNESPAPIDKRSGRITYDERGNSVWEWQLETGVYSRDISTSRLQKLDLNALSIADTAAHQRPAGLSEAAAKKPVVDVGSQPYDFGDLAIVETATHQRPPGLSEAPAKKPVPGGGFNPYDNTSTAAGNVGGNPYNSGGGASHKAEPQTEPRAPRKPMDLKQMQEWIEIRKRVEQNKKDEED